MCMSLASIVQFELPGACGRNTADPSLCLPGETASRSHANPLMAALERTAALPRRTLSLSAGAANEDERVLRRPAFEQSLRKIVSFRCIHECCMRWTASRRFDG